VFRRCCAQVVSVLFFVISELAAVEPMYQYSLAWFLGLFEATLVQADKARELHKRIDNLLQHFQYSLYLKVGDATAAAWGSVHGVQTLFNVSKSVDFTMTQEHA
jgi:hypothetical protein